MHCHCCGVILTLDEALSGWCEPCTGDAWDEQSYEHGEDGDEEMVELWVDHAADLAGGV